MTRKLLSGLTIIAVLASLSTGPAEAQRFKQGAGARASTGHGTSQHNQQLSNRGRGQSASPATTAAIQAATVYLQWRKCLDNMLPKCP